ncbi:di-heme oxidoreductase family protein [Sneathiella aquimaris]|uniref:di-heme oxidoreductase family protein n=1 Tax=Sneathiella aquimaris TaxID=2599305 RepID=UPI00146DE989|nr:di-heme oxidoredictase family protein [Sneathiella aquimaris]
MKPLKFGVLGVGIPLALLLAHTVAAAPANNHRTDLSQKDQIRVLSVTRPTNDFQNAETFEEKSAGATTDTARPSSNAFSQSSANLDFEGQRTFKLGNGLFRKIWVSSPSSTQASDGLGPLFNARSCQRCHLKDGRGHPPENASDHATSMFLRLSVPPKTEQEKADIASGRKALIPEPTYGGQLQDFAVSGLKAEGKMVIQYTEVPVELGDGTVVSLRKPAYSVADPGFGDLSNDVLLSPRIAPQMIGLGLLEAIHPMDIKSQADPEDQDGDGISGRISEVFDSESEEKKLGLFGWKASTPTVLLQSANAFAGDMGISSPMAPRHHGDCTANQQDCRNLPTGVQSRLGDTEAPDPVLELVAFYARNLAVPKRRNVNDTRTLKGKEIFYTAGCTACHTPKYVTRRDAPQKEHRFQLIWPYTDMLLHDMGPGLSDQRPVGSASGSEWRTAPLWGIGLTETVNGHTFFLHDGRARNLLEAILWHGGEAQASRDVVADLDQENREALLFFLNSL